MTIIDHWVDWSATSYSKYVAKVLVIIG